MYIERLRLTGVQIYAEETLGFIHPDLTFRPRGQGSSDASDAFPRPRLPNVNLIIGDNGAGKSTALRSIAMSCLGPAFVASKLPTRGLVRRAVGRPNKETSDRPNLEATFLLHEPDLASGEHLTSAFEVQTTGELERVTFVGSGGPLWDPVFESKNDAFFAVAYSATRRVEDPEVFDMAGRIGATYLRGQRLKGLFQESFSLIPMETWLPRVREQRPSRYAQVESVINKLLKPGLYRFTGEREGDSDYLFESRGGMKVPFRGLSDGYRAFIGWVGDMLFHACQALPAGRSLEGLRGIAMIDDIGLQLHPKWQLIVVPAIAKAFPLVQFILTSHSPLVDGSLEWMNILTLKLQTRSNQTKVNRFKESIHGLDADQVLASDFFGLRTTRAGSKARQLDELRLKASLGDDHAADLLISKLARGMEESE